MTILKSALVKGVLVATVAGGTLAATAASADIACNRWGECWHVHNYYDRSDYPAGVGVRFHNDSWGNRYHRYYHWRRDHDERGYYRNGLWITF
jgi:hypothetical protein